jgi:hypothetical protein
MHSPRKTADLLEGRLEAWGQVVARDENHVSDLIPLEHLWNQEFHLSDAYAVRYRTAVGEVLTSRGRLLDILEVIEQCWPNRRSWCERKKEQSSTPRILGRMWHQALRHSQRLQEELVLHDLTQLRARPISGRDEDENSFPELDVLYTYRDAKARLAALRELNANSVREEQVDSIADEVLRMSPSREGGALEWLSTQYIFNEHLFLWTYDGLSEARERRYRIIFDLAKLRDRVSTDRTQSDLQSVVGKFVGEKYQDIQGILRRITLFVEIFGYSQFVADVTQDGGQWGPASGVGSRGAINLVPGGRRSRGEKLVIGLARGRNRGARGSLRNVMKGIRKRMQESVDGTKIALVLTDLWDADVFEDSINDIELLKRQGKEFIFVLVNGRKLVPMEFSFR